jgi:hypothetical protein
MSVFIDNSTRFFAVVGAVYIPERHFDIYSDEVEHRAPQRVAGAVTSESWANSPGWWPHDYRLPGAFAACR